MTRSFLLLVCLIICAPAAAQDGARLDFDSLAPITADNVGQMVQVAKLGRGALLDAFLEDAGAVLTLLSTRGIWRFNAADLTAAPAFTPFEGDPFDGFDAGFFIPNLAYSADRRAVAIMQTYRSQTFGGTFDLRSGARLRPSSEGGFGVLIDFAPETGDAPRARLIDAASGAVRHLLTLGSERGRIDAAALSPDGALAALAGVVQGGGSTLQLWDTASGEKIAETSLERVSVPRLMFTDDSAQLILTASDSTRRYSVPDLALIDSQPYSFYTRSADGSTAAYVDDAGVLTIQDVAANAIRPTPLSGIDTRRLLHALMLSPDGARLYMVTLSAGAVYSVDTATGELLPSVGGFAAPINDLAFSADSARLIAVESEVQPFPYTRFSPSNAVRVHDLQSGQLSLALTADFPARAAISPTGQIAYSTRSTIHSIDGDQMFTYTDPDLPPVVHQLAFSPDGSRLAVSDFRRLLLFDTQLRLLAQRDIASGTFWGQSLAWDGAALIVGVDDAVRFFSTPALAEIGALDPGDTVQSIAFNPASRMLGVLVGAGFNARAIQLWDLNNAVPALRLTLDAGRARDAQRIAFNQDGSLLAAAVTPLGDFVGAAAVIYDTQTGAPRCELPICGLPMAFSPDGRLFACASLTSDVRLYAVGG